MGRISALTELTSLAQDDYLVVLDSSANIAKKITIANAFGLPDSTWTATGESWTYSSWDSATRIGVITVPTDATTKYIKGMRVRITQSTGGTKYGIIHGVTSTTLTIFFASGTTLNNEAITSPVYSALYAPFGFDAKPGNWQLEIIDTSSRQSNTPTNSTWYFPTSSACTLDIGIGEWWVEYGQATRAHASNSTYIKSNSTLSTTTNSETDTNFTSYGGSDQPTAGSMTLEVPHWRRRKLTLAAKTTYKLLHFVTVQTTMGTTNGPAAGARITATSAYIS